MALQVERRECIRNAFLGKGKTVAQQKTIFRRHFLNRLKSIRNDEIDRLRHIYEKNTDFYSVSDLQELLSKDADNKYLLKSEDLLDVLNQIEKEILEQEAEQYETEMLKETESIVESLLNRCDLCGQFSTNATVCADCVKLHFYEDLNQ